MRRIQDATAVYAQSSDIKSRTYLEYRKDMKKKAIAELEIREWFENKLKEMNNTDEVIVEKSGGDARLWFSRSGKISGEADYKARIKDREHNFEFQYADSGDLPFYDFKVSKVGRKIKGKRTPHRDRMFLYIIKPLNQFAVFPPEWIMENGKEEGVPAWGNRTAFRVPADRFQTVFREDDSLANVVETIDRKNRLLEIQSLFIEREKGKFSKELQEVVDEEKTFKIMPKTLEGFYKSCFLVDRVDDCPENRVLWLIYGTSFYADSLNSYEFARLIYSLDFLYAGTNSLEEHEVKALAGTIKKCAGYIEEIQKANLQTSGSLSPNEETVNFLFAVNLYEDMSQELIYTYGVEDIDPVNKIFQSVRNTDSVLANFKP